jgi:hypothetical protein
MRARAYNAGPWRFATARHGLTAENILIPYAHSILLLDAFFYFAPHGRNIFFFLPSLPPSLFYFSLGGRPRKPKSFFLLPWTSPPFPYLLRLGPATAWPPSPPPSFSDAKKVVSMISWAEERPLPPPVFGSRRRGNPTNLWPTPP